MRVGLGSRRRTVNLKKGKPRGGGCSLKCWPQRLHAPEGEWAGSSAKVVHVSNNNKKIKKKTFKNIKKEQK
jgi:hypothetical protein